MPIDALAHDRLTDEQVNAALLILPLLPDNVLIVLRHQQARIDDLTARIEDLEA